VSVGLHGNLRDFGIAEVFQLIGQQRKTGVLELARDDESVQFLFDRGAVVSAAPIGIHAYAALGEMLVRCGDLTREQVDQLIRECEAGAQVLPRLAVARGWIGETEIEEIEDLLTRETFFGVLRWSDGSFRFGAREVEHSRRFPELLGAEQILMDGLRMMDEWHGIAELVPSEDLVFRRCGDFETYASRLDATSGPRREAAQRVFELVDGRLAVRRIIDLSRLGTFDAMRILAGFYSAGAIEPTHAVESRRPRALLSDPARPRMQVRGWLGALLPLSLLAFAAVVSVNGVRPARVEGFAIHRDTLAAARAAYAARRVRHALEDHRMATGRHPQQLAELHGLPADALAPPGADTYYYAPREDGAVLLAPER
jgi:hypothetical protein